MKAYLTNANQWHELTHNVKPIKRKSKRNLYYLIALNESTDSTDSAQVLHYAYSVN